MEAMNQELDVLASRRAALEDEMAVSAVKREAVSAEITNTTHHHPRDNDDDLTSQRDNDDDLTSQ